MAFGYFSMFCCELPCYLRDFHAQVCLASTLQMAHPKSADVLYLSLNQNVPH